MSITRRRFLGSTAAAAGTLALPGVLRAAPAFAAESDGPRTPFEQTGNWSPHADELAFLDEVVAGAFNPVALTAVGMTVEDRPINLVQLGATVTGQIHAPRTAPTLYVIGSQHGNEPAGREACLQLIRDLAFTEDENLRALLSNATILITPSANPDGRERNSRTNSNGIDINRDHLILQTEEARAMAGVHLQHQPSLVVDHHEYSGTPVRYDDDVTFLWPRNLNADEQVRTLAENFCFDYIQADCDEAGYSADEYGQQKVGPYLFGEDISAVTGRDGLNRQQTAGDSDPGIARNAMGLRSSMGILIESYTGTQPYRPTEVQAAAHRARRVESQRVCMDAELRFMTEMGVVAKDVTDSARVRKLAEGRDQTAPLFFNGGDNDPATAAEMQDPAPLRYRLNAQQAAAAATTMQLHGMATTVDGDDILVSMAQGAEPAIGELLDARCRRNLVEATPEY